MVDSAEPVKQGLIAAFEHCGMPEEMLTGSRHAVVEHASGSGMDVADGVADAARDPTAFLWVPASADARESGNAFTGRWGAAMQRRGDTGQCGGGRNGWMNFAGRYNHVRPHEALEMKTPAAVWSKSGRNYQAHLPEWEYEAGASCALAGRRRKEH